jgi:hypothetical protein
VLLENCQKLIKDATCSSRSRRRSGGAKSGIEKLDDKLMGNPTDASEIAWAVIMLLGPAVLVLGCVAVLAPTRPSI